MLTCPLHPSLTAAQGVLARQLDGAPSWLPTSAAVAGEPMAGQINSGNNSLDENNDSIVSSSNNLKDRCFIKFGAFSVDVKQMLKAGNIDSMVTLPAKLIFQGDNFLTKIEATKQRRFIKSGYVSSRENIEKPRKYIFIGLMQVEIIEETPS